MVMAPGCGIDAVEPCRLETSGSVCHRRGELRTTRVGGGWRSRRDSNPRCRFCPHTPLAGEHLRPLGHSSKPDGILTPRLSYHTAACSRSNALCRARTASSMYFSSITTLVLISLVV